MNFYLYYSHSFFQPVQEVESILPDESLPLEEETPTTSSQQEEPAAEAKTGETSQVLKEGDTSDKSAEVADTELVEKTPSNEQSQEAPPKEVVQQETTTTEEPVDKLKDIIDEDTANEIESIFD